MDSNTIVQGMKVQFVPEFSEHLLGMVFEVETFDDGTIVHTAHESQGGYEFIMIRTRVNKRWGHRLARVATLIPATADRR